MKRIFAFRAVAIAIGAVAAGPGATAAVMGAQAFATEAVVLQTTVFAIENMTCALCPVTVKAAMEGVNGVNSVRIDFDAKTATVVFDPALTTAGAIAASSANAGYPAVIKG
ncbi:MAG: heavy-metal-associated domain-containing protein [Rhizobiales bacterium]|nr:heavy-metal-associated domain-containing protein [Hyphomicrobiales bacterium]